MIFWFWFIFGNSFRCFLYRIISMDDLELVKVNLEVDDDCKES